MRSLFLFYLLLIASFFVCPAVQAQKRPTSSEEFKRQREELLKELKDLPPEEARKIEELMKQADGNIKKSGSGRIEIEEEDTAVFFPSKMKTVSLYPRIQTRQELLKYVTGLQLALLHSIPEKHKAEIKQLVASTPSQHLSQLAIAAWYYKKAPVTAMVLATYAAEKNTGDPVTWNNLAALLNQGNVPEKAIPLLLHLLQKHPADPMLLNNTGQAYALLGDKVNAKLYLLRCIQQAPRHPEANCTLGYIAASDGNYSAATSYAKTSLEGGFTHAASDLLLKVESRDSFEPMISKVELPDYFDEYKIQLPRLQLLADEAAEIQAETRAFEEAVREESDKLYSIYAPLEEKGIELLQQEQRKLVTDPSRLLRFGRTFSSLAKYKIMRAIRNASADELIIRKLEEGHQVQIKELETRLEKRLQSFRDEYALKMKGLECGEGRGSDCAKLEKLNKELCAKLDQSVHFYLKDRAMVTEDYRRSKQMILLKTFYFNSFWQYLSGDNRPMATAAYYKAAQDYIHGLAAIHPLYTRDPACSYLELKQTKKVLSPTWEMECPVDISFAFAIGSLKINCDEASFSLGEGAQFSFSQQFKTRQSTFSIGIGASVSQGTALPGMEVKAEASMSQTFYISYDGVHKITDLGMKFGAGVSAGYGFSGNLSGGSGIVTGIGASKDGGNIKAEAGYTIGINSGYGTHIDFEEGPFKKIFSAEKQLNPKVGVYKK